jgi:heat shock protein HtpX
VSAAADLFAQQQANRRHSTWLVAGFVLFFAWLGFGGDWILYLDTRDAQAGGYRHAVPWFGFLLSAGAACLAWRACRQGPDRVMWASGATEILEPTTPRETRLFNVVEEMAIASGLPRPRVFIIHDRDPNALATGFDPGSACVAVTDGLLDLCTRDELQAVIGHEMGHVKNLDVRLMTLLAALVGSVALVSDGVGRMLRGGARIGTRGSARGGLVALWVVSWLLAPIVTRLLAVAVSRKREHLADAMSAQFTRNPMALATALEKIERAGAPTLAITRGAAHLCIVDPLGRGVSRREDLLGDLLASHPPMALRVARLKAMAYQQMKRDGTFRLPDPATVVSR